MSLVSGGPLVMEDLCVTMKCVTFTEPEITRVIEKYKGKISKRRYRNIIMLAHKRSVIRWKDFLNESKQEG